MSTHPAVKNGAYDVGRVRRDFPALSLQVYGKNLVYLDNAASAQKPSAVLERMTQAYTSEYANVHRGLHYLANAATEAYEGGRTKAAQFINAPRPEEVIFTRNATEAINLVASSWGGPNIKEGDEIVLSIMEHHSNIVPWHFLRERQGAVIKWAPVDDEGNFLIDEFEKLLTSKTKLVAITQMSNALGTIVPVKDVVKIAHARGASPCWSTAARAPCICLSTSRTSAATSTSSPATRSTVRPASACSGPSTITSWRCAPSTAAAR
ncbi:selenocysteine lyase/cysteine desulfurase [Bradyrhizobium sp. USDA 4463]